MRDHANLMRGMWVGAAMIWVLGMDVFGAWELIAMILGLILGSKYIEGDCRAKWLLQQLVGGFIGLLIAYLLMWVVAGILLGLFYLALYLKDLCEL